MWLYWSRRTIAVLQYRPYSLSRSLWSCGDFCQGPFYTRVWYELPHKLATRRKWRHSTWTIMLWAWVSAARQPKRNCHISKQLLLPLRRLAMSRHAGMNLKDFVFDSKIPSNVRSVSSFHTFWRRLYGNSGCSCRCFPYGIVLLCSERSYHAGW